MAGRLAGRTIAFLVANEGVEQVELTRPWQAVEAEGARPVLVAPEGGEVQAFHHLDKGNRFHVDETTERVDVTRFDALVLPGGVANPDRLRTDPKAVAFVKSMAASGRPIGVICHGPWTMVEADVVRGRRMTSWPSVQTDLRNAGANWVDEQVVVDEAGTSTIVSSRKPDDLDAFCRTIVDVFASTPAGAR